MSVLRRVVEAVFWVLLVMGQAPGALLLLLAGAAVRAGGVLPAIRALLAWGRSGTAARCRGVPAGRGAGRRAG